MVRLPRAGNSRALALRAARTPPPPPPPLHDRTGRVTAQHAQDAQHAHGTHTCGRTISFRNKPSVAVDALLKCSRRWQLVNDAIPCNKKSGFSTVQCTGLIVREPRRVVRCGGESTHIAVQLTNDDVRRPAEWRWRRPACSCFGAASLANERSRLDSVTVSTCKAQRYFTWAEIQFRRTPSYWEGGHFPTRFR